MDYVNAVSELNYMTQIVIMMYEDPTKEATAPDRFHVELHFSPGAYTLGSDTNPTGLGYRSKAHKKVTKKIDNYDLYSREQWTYGPTFINA